MLYKYYILIVCVFFFFKRPLRGKGYVPKMKQPDNQWFGHLCKNKKYMKLFCIYVMSVLQGNFLSIDYVRITSINIIYKQIYYSINRH